MHSSADGRVRLLCPDCRRGRIFLVADLFSPTRSFVTVRKPCPHCGSDTPLAIQAPPSDTQMRTSLSQAAWRVDGPIAPEHNDN